MKNRPKLTFLFVFVLIILFGFSNIAFSQNSSTKLLEKSDSLTSEIPQEKIYLHFDRPSYWAGDDIWFKVYLKNTTIPNCNVYLELLDSAGNVFYKDIFTPSKHSKFIVIPITVNWERNLIKV